MKIIGIFAVVEESLYAVKYENENDHEWSLCFERWNDTEYLYNFFTHHEKDLNHKFWGGISIIQAIEKTRRDAKLLDKKLLQLAKTGKHSDSKFLSTHFKPLSDGHYQPDLEKDKAYGIINPSWLRIYAIRIDHNLFVVSGGAIKLTKTMNTRDHLKKELTKLEQTKLFIQDHPDDAIEGYELY